MRLESLVANAGTPLMWAGCFMLIFGNYFIAYFEHKLITRRYGLCNTVWNPMIVANYLSMAVGIGLLYLAQPVMHIVRDRPFKYGLPFIITAWLVTYVVSVFVEWPFVAKTANMRLTARSLRVSAWVQAYSYSILVLIVHLLGSVSALTGLREVEIGDISTVSGWLYFIDDHAGEVRRIRLDGSKLEVVADLEYKPSPNHNRVLIEPSEDGEIASVAFHDLTGETRLVMKKVGAAKQAAPVELRDDKGVAIYGNVTFGPYSTRRFVKAPHVRTGFWAREGLTINGNCYALETPFMAEVWRNLVVLPDGNVIAQFGEAVFLIDHERGKVAHLVHGTGGDVLIDLEEP